MTTSIKNSLKTQFCQFCQKSLATKVAFVNGQKHGFTCNNCELIAVCN
jgi:RNase P subunit RPR2